MECWENHRHISRWWHICQHITGQLTSILCGNLAKFSISPSCCIAVAGECIRRLTGRTKILWKSSLQSLGACMLLHVCFCVPVCFEMFTPYSGWDYFVSSLPPPQLSFCNAIPTWRRLELSRWHPCPLGLLPHSPVNSIWPAESEPGENPTPQHVQWRAKWQVQVSFKL